MIYLLLTPFAIINNHISQISESVKVHKYHFLPIYPLYPIGTLDLRLNLFVILIIIITIIFQSYVTSKPIGISDISEYRKKSVPMYFVTIKIVYIMLSVDYVNPLCQPVMSTNY
jgi:hypothetical protein